MRFRPFALLLAVGTVTLVVAPASRAQAPAATDVAVPRPKPAQLPADSLVRARNFIVWLYSAQADSMWAHLGSDAQKQVGSAKELEEVSLDLAVHSGVEEQLLGERWVMRLGKRQYWRTARFSNSPEPLLIRLVMTPAGEIPGWATRDVASNPPPIDP